jgi:hypothetical protein
MLIKTWSNIRVSKIGIIPFFPSFKISLNNFESLRSIIKYVD